MPNQNKNTCRCNLNNKKKVRMSEDRVFKYNKKVDVESLGFIPVKEGMSPGLDQWFVYNKYSHHLHDRGYIYLYVKSHRFDRYTEVSEDDIDHFMLIHSNLKIDSFHSDKWEDYNLFVGNIDNTNELRRILEQTGVLEYKKLTP